MNTSMSKNNGHEDQSQKTKEAVNSSMSFKISLFILNVLGRMILKCSHLHFLVILKKIQQKFLTRYQNKNIATINKLAHAITIYFIYDEIPEKYVDLVKTEQEIFNKELEELQKNPEIVKLLSDYFRIKAFYYSYGWTTDLLKEKAEENIKKAKEYDNRATPLSNKDFAEINKTIKKSYKFLKKEYRKQLKEFISDQTARIIPKFEVKPAHLTFIISISTAVFLLSGYIYSKFFLKAFDIEVSKFFTLNDYLSASIDKIYFACVSAIIGTLVYLSGMYNRIRTEVESIHFEVKYKRSDFPMLIIIIMFSLLTVLAFYKNLPGKYGFLSMLIFFVLMAIYHKLPTEKFIKNDIYLSVFFVAFIYFGVHIFWTISGDIDRINRLSVRNLKKYNFQFNSDVTLDQNSVIFLTRTDDFFFFYDKKKNVTHVIPKSDIKLISSNRRTANFP